MLVAEQLADALPLNLPSGLTVACTTVVVVPLLSVTCSATVDPGCRFAPITAMEKVPVLLFGLAPTSSRGSACSTASSESTVADSELMARLCELRALLCELMALLCAAITCWAEYSWPLIEATDDCMALTAESSERCA